MLMVSLKNKSMVSVGTVLLASSVIFSGCIKENIIEVPKSKKLIIEGYKGVKNDNPNSRVYWEEDGSVSGGLAFHWENTEEGKEDMSILIVGDNLYPDAGANGKDKYKLLSFKTNRHENFGWARAKTTSNPLVSQIELKDSIDKSEGPLKPGYEIYSYLPLHNADILATARKYIGTMVIPREIKDVQLNSTRHLSPYIYMEGKGKINEELDLLTTKIYYNILPAIIRFKITNDDKTDVFVPELIRITGDISTIATVVVERNEDEETMDEKRFISEVIYSTGDKVGVRMKDATIPPKTSANTYCLVFPTKLTGKKFLIELEGMYNGKKVERLAHIPLDKFPDGGFKSNLCYTLNMKMSKSSFELGDITCSDWTGDTEEINTTPRQ